MSEAQSQNEYLAGKLGEVAAKREKTWDECSQEEKVERLRKELRQIRDLSNHAYRHANDARNLAGSHHHSSTTGEVLQPVNRHGGMASEVSARRYDPLR